MGKKNYILLIYINYWILFIYLSEFNSTSAHLSYLDCIKDLYNPEDIPFRVYFIDLKYYFDTEFISEQLRMKGLSAYEKPLFDAIKEAGRILESLVKIIAGWSPEIEDEDIFTQFGIGKWNRTLLSASNSYEQSMFSYGISFIVIFKLVEDMEENKIAIAKPMMSDNCGNPLVGVISINQNKDYTQISSEYLKTIMLQQLTHLLAFNKEILIDNPTSFDSLVEEGGEYLLTSDNVIDYAKKYFGCDSVQGIKMIIDEDNNFHWSSRYLLGEYMADNNYSEEQVFSGFTLALFKDLGYLEIKNGYTGGLMRFGKNQGCEFLEEKCIKNDGKKFKNDFYYPIGDQIDSGFIEPSCSSGRLSKTIHKLIEYENELPEVYRYFQDYHKLGGIESIDYCPVSMSSSNIIYSGSCSQVKNTPNTNIGESFSSHSFCALSSLVISDVNDQTLTDKPVEAVCFEMFCSEKSLSIKYGDYYFVCPREGGKIQPNGNEFSGYLLCPDYNLICTGTILCNNLFDCFSRASTEKESSFNYDEYEKQGEITIIRTTQISSEYISDENSYIGREESEYGKCPLNCAICKKKNSNREDDYQCIKCGNDFGLKGSTNNDNVVCVSSSDLEIGYYLGSNSVYYPCISNCDVCINGNSCQTCSSHYFYKELDNICEEITINCKIYDDNEKCTECNTNYGLVKEKNGDISCKKTIELQEQYYSIEEAGRTYYIKCSDEIDNCYSCSSSTFCHSCMDGYGIIDNHNEICQEITNEYYYDTDLNSYKLCSYKNIGCKKCEKIDNNDINCIECNTPYALIYSQINRCVLQTSIRDDKSIFFNSKTLKYYKCNDYRYHSVKNCLTCHDEEECDSCQNGYELSNSNVLCLSNIEINEKKYYKDANDNNYYPCSKLIKGCESCENAEKCLECNIAFDLDENDKCIPTALAMTRYYLNIETGRYVSCSKIGNCEECSSSEICTRCNSGYELNNNSCQKIEQKNDGNDKYKAIAIAGLVLGCVGIVGTICSILLIFFKKLLCKKSSSKASDATESVNPNNEQNDNDKNDVDIHSRRNLHNVKKDNSE